MSKELREMILPDGGLRGSARNAVVLVVFVGLFFPLQAGPSWLTSWMTVQAACFPVILVMTFAADSFAGERERHTLETLLASRLPARAILFGKIVAIVAYTWVLVVVSQVVALVGLNLIYRGGGVLFYRPAILVSILGVGLLAALFFCTLGVLASLTAPTVRAAGQRMVVPFLALFCLPAFAPVLAKRLHFEAALRALGPGAAILLIAGTCTLLSAVLMAVALRRFTRERLVLA